jgi:REP element-mobilizing transposase RayT
MRYEFEVIEYVVMPEHIHLLISEPKRRTVPIMAHMLKEFGPTE